MTRFLKVSPRLPVRDLQRAIQFYGDMLGFTAGEPWPADEPIFVLMERDEVVVQFYVARANEPVGNSTIAIDVEDALAVHAAVRDRVEIEWGPEDYSYGRREFSFRDPEGYAVIISEETSGRVSDRPEVSP